MLCDAGRGGCDAVGGGVSAPVPGEALMECSGLPTRCGLPTRGALGARSGLPARGCWLGNTGAGATASGLPQRAAAGEGVRTGVARRTGTAVVRSHTGTSGWLPRSLPL